ncbi:MAG: transposase [Alphaproteobacteria bacterium]|nr:transposase [Alphaproteobacteria bacterium]
MGTRPRVTLAGVPVHVVQRGVDRQACFFTDADRVFYLEELAELGAACRCALHAYVLMSNHVHLLLTPADDDGPSRLMQRLGQRYVKAVNRAYGRTGTLWEGRFRSTVATDEAYVLACYRYIELNPVRARMVAGPGDYPWSSHRMNATGAPAGMLVPHERFCALGIDTPARALAYRALFDQAVPDGEHDEIRTATNGNHALGSPRFRAQIEAMLGRRVTPRLPGRPRKAIGAAEEI